MGDSVMIHLLLALFLPYLSLPSVAQTFRNVTLGSSLTASDDGSSLWPSPSGDFAFGFRRIDSSDLFLLAIWFNKIPDRTIVWSANGDTPAQRGSKIQLTTDGFVLNDPQGREIWKATPSNSTGIAFAAMLDSGNFVLASKSSGYSWESFNNPTDTILPTQKLERGAGILSRFSATNYTKGRFELRMDGNGTLVVNTKGWPTNSRYKNYYSSPSDPLQQGLRLVFNESGYIYIEKNDGSKADIPLRKMDPITDFYYRATLDFDGVFTLYSHPRTSNGNQTWSTLWSIPDDICVAIFDDLGSGACGFNSYCTLTSGNRPTCACPPGYSPIDSANEFGGCKPNFALGCEEKDEFRDPNDVFKFEEFTGFNWPLGDYDKLEFPSEQECRRSCMNDCLCAAVIFREFCWKKKLPLSNGRLASPADKLLIKVRRNASAASEVPCPRDDSGRKKKDQGKLTWPLLLGGSVLVNFLLVSVISVGFFLIYRKRTRAANPVSSVTETNLRVFTYEDLEAATDGFKEELGRGSFGIVYKGVLGSDSANLVAVKMLDRIVQQGEREFKAEVAAIGKTHHRNLVQLLGFCQEGPHRLLVYEFMSNGTLARFLFGNPKPEWRQRMQAAIDIARGLAYLHEECKSQIIHCDIKPQNILLDDYFIARISDFGLAKLLMVDQTRTHTGIRGTRGYVAPEWLRSKPVTVKVDVYSYGVMLLEIICCRRNLEQELEEAGKAILTDWVYNCLCEWTLEDLVSDDKAAFQDMERVKRWVMIAIWCIQEDPSLRPTMKMVINMLEGIVEVPLPPSPSFSSVA